MTNEEKLIKNNNIKQSMKDTLARRSNQQCFVYKVKIDYSKLKKKQKESLKMLFVEAKWLYNDILNYSKDNNILTYNTKTKIVNILNKNKEKETKKIKYLGSQMKQSILTNMIASIKTLSTLKKHGYKVGNLKFISEYKSINLKQYENTYKIYNHNTMKIQGVYGKIKVNGLKQLTPNMEVANAKILNTPTGYYIAITVFINKDKIFHKPYIGTEIGIDMGIKDSIVFSNGEKYKANIEETERLKRLQQKLSRQVKGSNNRWKNIQNIRKEYQKLSNKKNDISNKLVNYIFSYEHIYIQDEMISNWHKGLFGKQVQHSILGRVKSKLINNPRVEVLDKSVPTTKYCPKCGNINKSITLDNRTYICPVCGYTMDRDIHSANNMIIMTKIIKNNIPMEHRDLKPVEIEPLNQNIVIYSDSSSGL